MSRLQRAYGIDVVSQGRGSSCYQLFRFGRSIGYVQRCGPAWEVYADAYFADGSLSIQRTRARAIDQLRLRDDQINGFLGTTS